jgi:enoyl-CoA hydratase/carnithine racemase
VGWQVEADTLVLTLRNLARRNALSPTLLNELAYGLTWAESQPAIRFVRLRAEGEVFCAGADLQAFAGQTESYILLFLLRLSRLYCTPFSRC